MAELAGDLDLALIPVGGWGPTLRGGHMDPTRAAEALALLRPRIAVAIHWGTLWPFGMGRIRRDRFEEPARRFIAEAARLAPSVSVPRANVRVDRRRLRVCARRDLPGACANVRRGWPQTRRPPSARSRPRRSR